MKGAEALSRGSLGETPAEKMTMNHDTTEVMNIMTTMKTRLNTTEVLDATMTKRMLNIIKDDTTEVLTEATMTTMKVLVMLEIDTTEVLETGTMTELPGESGQCAGRPRQSARAML